VGVGGRDGASGGDNVLIGRLLETRRLRRLEALHALHDLALRLLEHLHALQRSSAPTPNPNARAEQEKRDLRGLGRGSLGLLDEAVHAGGNLLSSLLEIRLRACVVAVVVRVCGHHTPNPLDSFQRDTQK
jgi:hypothetical protein